MSEVNKQFEKFANQFGKQENQEMAMYFKAGWIAAIDKVMGTLKEIDKMEKTIDKDTIIISSGPKKIKREKEAIFISLAGQAMSALIGTISISDDEQYNYQALSKDAFEFAEAMINTYEVFYESK